MGLLMSTPRSALQRGGWRGRACGDFGWWLGRQLQFQLLQQQAELGFGFGIAGEQQLAAVGGRQVHIDHLHGGELFQHAARRQPGPAGGRRIRTIGSAGKGPTVPASGSLSLRFFGGGEPTRVAIKRLVVSRGTDGSNPSSSQRGVRCEPDFRGGSPRWRRGFRQGCSFPGSVTSSATIRTGPERSSNS